MTHLLDASGLRCPMPILKARKVLKEVPPGEILEVLATDPGSVADFTAFCEATGCEMLESAEKDGVYSFRLKKPE
ncbi:MAG TPA: SirA family protein [Rhodospirillaceae bacterium]|jgi:tRNA 2-thiouridine synthesizing protein A|nr:sulfurtransferase TusA family protein [Alphaproteobacteria bacterium]MDP6660379.1 sulfurtransferase TusA family protein [Alphaproteobacteria bacterium]MDP6781014.1 sulfurtransferase TusA family protein [Alphaproteobacteria bacterium]HAQ32550.1 SirA family protein [Rhodospirillaceae bacterium]